MGFIGGSKESEISNMREAGYRNAMESFGLPARAEWFLNGDDFYEASGYKAMTRLIEAGSCPRHFAASDQIAIGAIQALQEHGLNVPDDMSIIGCDDIEACKYTTPKLTTIRQNKEKIGRLAALMLYDLIHKQSPSAPLSSSLNSSSANLAGATRITTGISGKHPCKGAVRASGSS